MKFLSTLPARGATEGKMGRPISLVFLSTLPARGATDLLCPFFQFVIISIHAPREGSDSKCAEK